MHQAVEYNPEMDTWVYLWFAAVAGFLVRSWWLHHRDYGVKIL